MHADHVAVLTAAMLVIDFPAPIRPLFRFGLADPGLRFAGHWCKRSQLWVMLNLVRVTRGFYRPFRQTAQRFIVRGWSNPALQGRSGLRSLTNEIVLLLFQLCRLLSGRDGISRLSAATGNLGADSIGQQAVPFAWS
ncbi:hypothetical protein N005_26795 [Pseudomonas mediterranea CFBP 5447]|nr:hypothetical protein N005_26795 [Pseudomonas mediterranea CFBP 5447]